MAGVVPRTLFPTAHGASCVPCSYVNFLCHLCVCDGVGIANNQLVLAQYLTRGERDRLLPLQAQHGQGPAPGGGKGGGWIIRRREGTRGLRGPWVVWVGVCATLPHTLPRAATQDLWA